VLVSEHSATLSRMDPRPVTLNEHCLSRFRPVSFSAAHVANALGRPNDAGRKLMEAAGIQLAARAAVSRRERLPPHLPLESGLAKLRLSPSARRPAPYAGLTAQTYQATM